MALKVWHWVVIGALVLLVLAIVGYLITCTVSRPTFQPIYSRPYTLSVTPKSDVAARTKLVSYADPAYKKDQWRNALGAIQHGFAEVQCLDPSSIDSEFARAHHSILSQSTGAGYWLWKPYVIMEALKACPSEDSIIFYSDSGTWFNHDASELLQAVQQHDAIAFEITPPEHMWTKGDVFTALECRAPEYMDTPQRCATWFGLKNTAANRAFVTEWLHHASQEQLITDAPSLSANHPSFVGHRHDQSLFSVLSKKHKLYTVPYTDHQDTLVKAVPFVSKHYLASIAHAFRHARR
jgi:hypothetical protein